MEKICKECKNPFEATRRNQLYHPKCKIEVNNRIAREFNEQTKDVSNILKKNFKILKALQERNSETISLIRLNKEGFNLQFHTHQMFDSELNKPILFTYCLGLIEIKQKHYELREFTIR